MDLDQGIELVDLHARLLLLAVTQKVWQDGLVVRNVGAQRDCDGLAFPVAAMRKVEIIWTAKERHDIQATWAKTVAHHIMQLMAG